MAGSASTLDTSSGSNPSTANALTTGLLIVAALTAIVGFTAMFATWFQAKIDPGGGTLQIAAKQLALGHLLPQPLWQRSRVA